MSSLDREVIHEKLGRLELVSNLLTQFRAAPRAEFSQDPKLHGAAMYNLAIGIEIIVDIGNHILASVFQKSEKTYKDTLVTLGEVGVVPKEFADENKEMADFRNKLIHDYGRVDLDRVHEYLQKAPEIFRQYAKYYTGFLNK